MSYRKFKADNLFTGTEMLGGTKVLVAKSDGEIEAIIDLENAGEDIETLTGILCPGLINAHCHLELSHMKGLIPERTGLVDFVYKVVNERHLSGRREDLAKEQILQSIEDAEAEMILNGIVAVGDICNNISTLPQKLKQRLSYYNFIEASGWLPDVAAPRFSSSRLYYEAFSNQFEKAIVPHAPYSVSEELWKLITPYFQNKTVSIHNQETLYEDEFFIHGSGDLVRMYKLMNIDNTHHAPSKISSLQTYFSKFSGAAAIILVHNTFTKQEDIDFIKGQAMNSKSQTFFCICIKANQYIENAVPPINLLISNNCNLVLGTDSLASNNSLNLLEEMKTIQKKFPGISLETMLQWGTINGAKALQMDDILGSFEHGKKPGIIIIDNVQENQLKQESSAKRIL